MPLNIIRVNLELDRVHCHDEGDGLGSAEPYLWAVYFKIDGSNVQVTDSFTLTGSPMVRPTPGSHGNLGNTDVDQGESITIPPALGEWDVVMSPIKGPKLPDLDLEFGGVVGVVVVMMEEDNVTDAGADAGHHALNEAVRAALQRIIDTRSISDQDVSEEEINQFTNSIGSAVEAAIVNQQNLFENLWSWLNPDDTIGSKVFLFSHDELNAGTTRYFSHRWKSEGDWEIFGHVTSTVACPAEASKDLLDLLAGGRMAAQPSMGSAMQQPVGAGKQASVGGRSAGAGKQAMPGLAKQAMAGMGIDISPMRRFRDGGYRNYPGLGKWFSLAAMHSPRVAYLITQKPELANSLRAMLEWGNVIADKPDSKITDQQIDHADKLLLALANMRSPSARMDASRARSMLKLLKGKTNREALELLDRIEPARYPSIMGKRMSRKSLAEAIRTKRKGG